MKKKRWAVIWPPSAPNSSTSLKVVHLLDYIIVSLQFSSTPMVQTYQDLMSGVAKLFHASITPTTIPTMQNFTLVLYVVTFVCRAGASLLKQEKRLHLDVKTWGGRSYVALSGSLVSVYAK